jgi:hypothetical protein
MQEFLDRVLIAADHIENLLDMVTRRSGAKLEVTNVRLSAIALPLGPL